MQPRFVELPEMKVVGFGGRFISVLSPKRNNYQVIPALWHKLVQVQNTIPHQTGQASLALVEMLPAAAEKSDPAEMYYLAGVMVASFEGMPAEFEQRTLAAGRYALFTHVGKVDQLGKTMAAIYQGWLPGAGVKLRPSAHLEWYDKRFDMNSEKSELDILLPV